MTNQIKKKVKFKGLILIMIIVFGYLFYYFPLQKYLAEKNFNSYIQAQGISESSIKEKDVFKDYKQNGYYICVVYKDDPDWKYEYQFRTNDLAELFSKESIMLIIYDKENAEFNFDDVDLMQSGKKQPLHKPL